MNANDRPDVDGLAPATDPALEALVDALRRQHRDAVEAVLLYGSCLRSGDLFDGLVDLYLVVRGYRAAYGGGGLALANAVLPPNVFYAEQRQGERILRSKVTVIALDPFRRACSHRRFESYFWGRFSQPVRIVFARDAAAREAVEACLDSAAVTLLDRALPALADHGTVASLWQQALALSYGTELRTERPGRARELVQGALPWYRAAAARAAPRLRHRLELTGSDDEPSYRAVVSSAARRRAGIAWGLRRVQGKGLSVARLVKALFTFSGGIDYIAWKLERHSGEHIEVPERVRRHPLLFSWGFFWRLYRRGIFR